MQINDVLVNGQQSSEWNSVTKFELQFGYDRGIVTSLCPHSNDQDWDLNIKRGVISAFQNHFAAPNEKYLKMESDVTGNCPTEYVRLSGRAMSKTGVFRKIKNMDDCTANQKLEQFALNLPDLNLQHVPLVKYS